jgi:hypothetical protein
VTLQQGAPASQTRDEVEALVINDFPGPLEVPTPITDRYLVGKLAPRDLEIPSDQDDELAVADGDSPEEGAWSRAPRLPRASTRLRWG